MAESGLITRANVYATSVATATDFLSSDVAPTHGRSTFRLTVQLASAAKLSIEVDDGSTQKSLGLSDDTDLTAGQLFTFCWGVDVGFTYNFRHDDGGAVVVDYFLLEEILGGEI
jgi:hypothetical protein